MIILPALPLLTSLLTLPSSFASTSPSLPIPYPSVYNASDLSERAILGTVGEITNQVLSLDLRLQVGTCVKLASAFTFASSTPNYEGATSITLKKNACICVDAAASAGLLDASAGVDVVAQVQGQSTVSFNGSTAQVIARSVSRSHLDKIHHIIFPDLSHDKPLSFSTQSTMRRSTHTHPALAPRHLPRRSKHVQLPTRPSQRLCLRLPHAQKLNTQLPTSQLWSGRFMLRPKVYPRVQGRKRSMRTRLS